MAAKVLWTLLKLEWQRGIAFLESLWEGFKGFWSDAVTGLAMFFVNAAAEIRIIWAELVGWMQKQWNAFKLSGFTETLTSWFTQIYAKMTGQSPELAKQVVKDMFKADREAAPKSDAAIDAGVDADRKRINAERSGTLDELARDKLRADKERQAKIDAAKAEADAARKELDQAAAEAKAARAKAEAKTPESLVAPKTGLPDISNLAAQKAAVAGTFSSAALSGLGTGNTVEEKMEGHLAEIKEGMGRLVDVNERIERNMADGVLLA